MPRGTVQEPDHRHRRLLRKARTHAVKASVPSCNATSRPNPKLQFARVVVKSLSDFAHADRSSKAIATPAANAKNDSSAITGTGGHGAAPPITMAGAACEAASMPA